MQPRWVLEKKGTPSQRTCPDQSSFDLPSHSSNPPSTVLPSELSSTRLQSMQITKTFQVLSTSKHDISACILIFILQFTYTWGSRCKCIPCCARTGPTMFDKTPYQWTSSLSSHLDIFSKVACTWEKSLSRWSVKPPQRTQYAGKASVLKLFNLFLPFCNFFFHHSLIGAPH